MPDRLLVDDPAPAFSISASDGSRHALNQYRGQKVVVFFFPKANTPGCTKEAAAFSRLAPEFAKAGTVVFGISADSAQVLERFRMKHGLAVPLISDESRTVINDYQVWGKKSMYGKTFSGILRTTYLIDGAGRIARIWTKVRMEGHAEEVLAAARAL